jgi:hypothetical protein
MSVRNRCIRKLSLDSYDTMVINDTLDEVAAWLMDRSSQYQPGESTVDQHELLIDLAGELLFTDEEKRNDG